MANRAPTSESPPASGLFRPHSGLSPKPKLGQARTQFWLRASWAALPGARCQGGIASKSVGKPEATTAWPPHGQLFPSESQLPNPHLLPAFFGFPVASFWEARLKRILASSWPTSPFRVPTSESPPASCFVRLPSGLFPRPKLGQSGGHVGLEQLGQPPLEPDARGD